MHDHDRHLQSDRLLQTYLNDHLAGARLGIELMRRIRDENEGTRLAELMDELLPELEEDRDVLAAVVDELDLRQNPLKQAVAMVAERVARMKLNRRLISYSPLSRFEELEMMSLGILGKQKLWRALASVASERGELSGYDFEALAHKAQRQHDLVEDQRVAAGESALA